MKHHLIALFLAATMASVLTAVWAVLFVAPPLLHEVVAQGSDVSAAYLESQPDLDDGFTTSTEEEPATPQIATGTVMLRTPSVAYLLRVAGEPTLKKDEIGVRVPVLMYHHIRRLPATATAKERTYSVSPEAFAAQMEELVQAGYHTISPDELDQALKQGYAVLPTKPVLLTFDDGYKNQFENAYPVMKRLGLKSTFFIVSEAHIHSGSMTQDMIKQLDQEGLVTIAAHTRHHPFLSHLGAKAMQDEIEGSKTDLETLLGHPVTAFAYPYGAWSAAVVKEVEQAGFTLGFWVRMGSLHGESSRYLLRRIRVLDGESIVPTLDAFSATSTDAVTSSTPAIE